MSDSGRNLVMGQAEGYGPEVFQRYLQSLRATGYDGDVVLFLRERDVTPEIRAIMECFNCVPGLYGEAPFLSVNFRFSLYLLFLRERMHLYRDGWVLHTDVRDVLFQANPFTYAPRPEGLLWFFAEKRKIGECRFNSGWIREGFGEQVLTRFADRWISCSGTSMGRGDAYLAYLETMNEMFKTQGANGRPNSSLPDQGLHNFILYERGVAGFPITLLDNEHGPIATLGYAEMLVDSHGRILDQNRRVAPVAHQFDRWGYDALLALAQKQSYPFDDLLVRARAGVNV